MFRNFCASFAFMISLGCAAAAVDWNSAFVYVDEDWSGFHDAAISIGAPPYIPAWGDRVDGGWKLTASGDTFMEYANTCVLAMIGDVVDDACFSSRSSYFSYAELGGHDSDWDAYSVFVLPDAPTYLAFRNQTAQGTTYGWLLLGVSDSGDLFVESSAWDREGCAIVVGGGSATPEPSCTLLLLLGLGALVLRRRPREIARVHRVVV